MNHLKGITHNIVYKKNDNEFEPHIELIFLCDAPDWRLTNDGDIIRERKLERYSFYVPKKELKTIAGQILKIDASEEDKIL